MTGARKGWRKVFSISIRLVAVTVLYFYPLWHSCWKDLRKTSQLRHFDFHLMLEWEHPITVHIHWVWEYHSRVHHSGCLYIKIKWQLQLAIKQISDLSSVPSSFCLFIYNLYITIYIILFIFYSIFYCFPLYLFSCFNKKYYMK